MRVGVDTEITPPVTNSSTQVVVVVKMYTQNDGVWPENDTMTLNYGGDMSGTANFTNRGSDGTGPVLRDTRNYIQGYSNYGVSPGTVLLGATISGTFNNITPSRHRYVTLPPRPVAVPLAPSGFTAVRNNDGQATLSWTNNASAPRPYSSPINVLERRWNKSGSFEGWTDWYTIGPSANTATSRVVTGLEANHVYQWEIRSNNAAGSSAWVLSPLVYMTPAAPSNVVSRMNAAGTQITTTWTDNAYTYGSTGQWRIQRSVNGGAYADLATVTPKSTLSYTDTSPGAVSNRYRVAAFQTQGSLTSAYVAGALIVPSPPLAPTLLSPNGSSVDFNGPVTFSWQHNPGTDGALQSAFTIGYSTNGGASYTALPGADTLSSTVSSFVLPGGVLSNGVPYLWRVRTWGVTAQGSGPPSVAATVTGYDRPTVTITSPDAPITNVQPLVVEWAYNQAQSSPQASWNVSLWDATGTFQYEQRSGSGTTSSVILTTLPENNTTYLIRVQVTAGNGVSSQVTELTTTYILIPPADATVSGFYDQCTGTVTLTLGPGTAVPGTTVDTASVNVERRADQGEWVTLGIGILLPTDFVDPLPMTNGINEYRVISRAAGGGVSQQVVRVDGTDGAELTGRGRDPLWVWISYGDSFENRLRLHGEPSISETADRERATQAFLGRSRPVAMVGANTTRTVAVSGQAFFDRSCLVAATAGNCTYDSSPREWRLAGLDAEVVCYRDYTGRRLFGTLGAVSTVDGVWPGKAGVSFSVEEVDFVERYVRLVTTTDTEA